MNERDDTLPDGLHEVGGRLRAHRHVAEPIELDTLKRRSMAQASTSTRGKGNPVRTRFVTLSLIVGLIFGGSTAGVIAAKRTTVPPAAATPAKSQYQCNSGIGNGSEQPPTPPSQDCDPGNSPGNNATNPCEGPPTMSPSTGCLPKPQPGQSPPKPKP